MPTIDQLIAEVNDLSAKRDARDAAHAATLAAQQAVIVAQASQQQRATEEAAAVDAEDTSFNTLLSDLQAFKAETPDAPPPAPASPAS